MIGAILLLVGIGLGIAGWLLLRSQGSGWRIGRLLSAAPHHSLAEATELAAAELPVYIRVHGRIDSKEEFPGEAGKPAVFRRRRLQHRAGRSDWATFDDERLAVPFGLSDRGERVAIDADALGDGLVVVPRISEGTAAELPPQSSSTAVPQLAPETAVRLRIEQVSSVDHATAAGVPRISAAGDVVLGPGLGRPLLLTTLEVDEAMRVLASDQRTGLLLASGLLVASPIVILVGVIALLLRL